MIIDLFLVSRLEIDALQTPWFSISNPRSCGFIEAAKLFVDGSRPDDEAVRTRADVAVSMQPWHSRRCLRSPPGLVRSFLSMLSVERTDAACPRSYRLSTLSVVPDS